MVKFLSGNCRLLLLLLLLPGFHATYAQDATAGQKIFESTCTSCHQLGGVLIGPDLKGVKDRWKDEAKLISFVQNPQKFVDAGDPYVKGLVAKYNQVMTPQPLTDQQVKDVIAYAHTGGSEATSSAEGGPQTNNGGSFTPVPDNSSFATWLFWGVIILMFVIILLSVRILAGMKQDKAPIVQKPEEDKGYKFNWNNANAIIMPLFLIVGFILIVWEYKIHMGYVMPGSASEHGAEIDTLFEMTTIITGIVFVITQVLLFVFPFMYRKRKGHKAFHYSHNNTVEFLWTSIPAVVLAALVLYGFRTWRNATNMPQGAEVIEIEAFAKQFEWHIRFPGPDGKLGKTNYAMIDAATNPLGLDFSDPNAHDDFSVLDMHVPVGKEILVHARSQDVTHSVYLPHFRAQIYAQPGLDNRIHFKPIKTTSQMRQELRNEKFDFELACNQLCGTAHFNMRRLVIVDDWNTYETWLKTDKQTLYEKYTAAKKLTTDAN